MMRSNKTTPVLTQDPLWIIIKSLSIILNGDGYVRVGLMGPPSVLSRSYTVLLVIITDCNALVQKQGKTVIT